MKHYQTPETLLLQVENSQTLCASGNFGAQLAPLNYQHCGASWVGWDSYAIE